MATKISRRKVDLNRVRRRLNDIVLDSDDKTAVQAARLLLQGVKPVEEKSGANIDMLDAMFAALDNEGP